MTSSQISSPATDPWQNLTGLYNPLVLCAPKTWCDAFVLVVAVCYSHHVQVTTLLNTLSSLHCGLKTIFSLFDLQSLNQWDVDKYLPLYFQHEALKEEAPSQRTAFWGAYQAVSRHLKRWLASLPAEQQQQYHPFIFPFPDDPQELTRLSGTRTYRTERRQKRKEDTDC